MAVHAKLANRTCYHKYEVEPGAFTPGLRLELEPRLCLDELHVPENLAGLRALDIGAFDGPFTFELERRGALVTALDIQDPDVTVFNAVKEIKKSSATYVRGSIYNALPQDLGVFDVVLFAGVYYHLRNPILALQRIRQLLVDGGTLFVEGAGATDYLAETLTQGLGLPPSSLDSVADFVDRLPITYLDVEAKLYGHSSFWYPTSKSLEAALLDSGFWHITCELKPNAFYKYSHRRLMARAEVDPAKSGSHEHTIYVRDFGQWRFSTRLRKRLSRALPAGMRQILRRMRRAGR